jgi:hypothetical protein
MRNRILLYLVSFAATLLLFVWVKSEFFDNGGDFSNQNLQPIAGPTGLGISPLVYEDRDPQSGDLLYVIIAQSAKPSGNDQYHLIEPRMRFYTNSGQCILVSSDAGDFTVDQVNGSLSTRIFPRSGELYGNVAITIGPIDSFQGDDLRRRPGQIQVLMSQPIRFDYQEGLLTSPGSIRIRGDQLQFDGADLTVEIDVAKKTLDFLQVTRGQQLVIRNALVSGRQNGPLASGAGPAQTSPAATAPARMSAAASPAIYQLRFGQDVIATLAGRSISAYNLSLLFSAGMGGNGAAEESQPAPQQNSNQPTTGPSTLPANLQDSGSSPIDPQHDLVLTWVGALLVKPDDAGADHLLNSRDVILKATGRPDYPVLMSDGADRTATADEVDYETANQTLEMFATGLEPLTLIDKSLGTLTCRRLVYENIPHRISFFGSGHWRYTPKTAGGGSWHGSWTTGLTLTLAPAPALPAGLIAAGAPAQQQKLQLKNLIMTGNATLIGSGMSVASDILFADIANFIGPDKTWHQALSYFSATGHVLVNSWRPGASGQQADPDSIACSHLQILTVPAIAGNPHSEPVPSVLLADTGVNVLFHQRAGELPNAAPDATPNSAALPNAATDAATNSALTIYQLNSEHLMADLITQNSPSPTGSNPFSGRYTVGQFRLWQNLQIQIINLDRPITATAWQIAGDRVAGTATLSPADPTAPWPEIEQGASFITGEKILLNRTGQSLQIVGPGKAGMPSDLASGNATNNAAAGNKTNVTLRWTSGMFFHGEQQLAEFDGGVTASLTGQKDPVLSCSRLQALLYRPTGQDRTLRLAKIIAFPSTQEPLVVARDSSFDDAGTLLTRLYMQCTGLTYDAVNGELDIPNQGELGLEDYRPVPVGSNAGQQRGQSGFSWDQGFKYHAATGIIDLLGSVHMVFQPMQPFNANTSNIGGVLPQNGALSQNPDPNSDLAILDCDELSAKMSRQNNQAGANMDLGLGGQTRLMDVQAQRGDMQLLGIRIAADVLEFDAVNQQAVAYSLDNREAFVSDVKGQYHGSYQKAIWDMSKGRSGLELINPHGAIEVQQ